MDLDLVTASMDKGRGAGVLERRLRMVWPRRMGRMERCVQREGIATIAILPSPFVIISTSSHRRSPRPPCMQMGPASTSEGGGPAHASGPRQGKIAAIFTAVACPCSPSFVVQAMTTAHNIHVVAMVCVASVASAAKRVPRSPGPGKPRDFRGWVHDACAVAGSVRQAAPCRVVCVLRVVQRASA